MISLGFDSAGDEHVIFDVDADDKEELGLHKADTDCGCNPDSLLDDPAYRGDYKTPATTSWSHHSFKR